MTETRCASTYVVFGQEEEEEREKLPRAPRKKKNQKIEFKNSINPPYHVAGHINVIKWAINALNCPLNVAGHSWVTSHEVASMRWHGDV